MDTEFNNSGRRKQLHGGCKRNESRPGRGGKPKCQRCRKAGKEVFHSSFEELIASVVGIRKVSLVTGAPREVSG
jgi:hypothetical protein